MGSGGYGADNNGDKVDHGDDHDHDHGDGDGDGGGGGDDDDHHHNDDDNAKANPFCWRIWRVLNPLCPFEPVIIISRGYDTNSSGVKLCHLGIDISAPS